MSFESELTAEISAIKTKAFEGVKTIASHLFSELCDNSPHPGSAAQGGRYSEYALGSYVLSHRINGGSADTSTTELGQFGDDNANAMAAAEARSNELPKLQSITPFEDIVISNSTPYNENIEYLGWTATTLPYHTFRKTEGPMETIAQQIMDGI